MSLTSALHLGHTGLLVNQTALEVTGNNLANVATEGYTRQRVTLGAGQPVETVSGQFVGTGVRIQQIARVVDEALNGRLRMATSEHESALARQSVLSQIESVHGSLGDQDLSTRLGEFLASFNELANSPTDTGLRSLVITEGRSLADYLKGVGEDLAALRTQIDDGIRTAVVEVDSLLTRIGQVNLQIAQTEGAASGEAGTLRDERDRLLGELSRHMDITVHEQPSGTVDVLVGSTPVVLGSGSRGLDVSFETVDGAMEVRLRTTRDGSPVEPRSGRLGAMIESRDADVDAAVDQLNTFTANLIFQLNKVHSGGQGESGFASLTSFNGVSDSTLALNDPETDLAFTPGNGSFQFHVTQKSTGARASQLVEIDLDGIGTDTTLDDLVAALDGVANVSATIGLDGRVTISSDSSDFEFSFSEDSSGVLAALGINTFFTGSNVTDIAVNQRLIDDPSLLAAGQDHVSGDNANALALAKVGDAAVAGLGGVSLRDYWSRHVQDYAVRTAQTNQDVSAAGIVADSLTTQKASVSGVNLDEEAINMLTYQRAYQGAARFITVVDELTQVMLNMIR